jgi:SAM-dependent methyltransferase
MESGSKFQSAAEETTTQRGEMLQRYSRRNARVYRVFRPPLPLIHNRAERFLPQCEGAKLFIGGAAGAIPRGFLNVDSEYVPGVDIVADVQRLPFRTESVAAIECDAVLEHVPEPQIAVQEMLRVLRPGGFLHVLVPFCQPFHGYPSDYQRWTVEGLRHLLRDFQVIDVGVRTGPTATLLGVLGEYVKLVVPRMLRKPAYVFVGWIIWPLRYLDLWLNRKPEAHILANSVYILAKKP